MSMLHGCNVVGIVDTCLEQDLSTFEGSCQDTVKGAGLRVLAVQCIGPVKHMLARRPSAAQ